MLGDGKRHPSDVHLLKRVLSDGGRSHLRRYGQHRRRIQVGGSDPGDQVRSSRPRRRKAHPHLPRRPGITVGGVRRSLLVAREDGTDGVIRQHMVQDDGRPARDPKNGVHTLSQEALADDLRTAQFHSFLLRHDRNTAPVLADVTI